MFTANPRSSGAVLAMLINYSLNSCELSYTLLNMCEYLEYKDICTRNYQTPVSFTQNVAKNAKKYKNLELLMQHQRICIYFFTKPHDRIFYVLPPPGCSVVNSINIYLVQ